MIRPYWNAWVVFIGTFNFRNRFFASYDPLYCLKEKRVLIKKEIPLPLEALCHAMASEHGVFKLPSAFEEHSPLSTVCEYKKDFIDRSETYLVILTYYYSPEERPLLAQQGKNIVGIAYHQSYSACGHPTFGWHETLWE